jgi:hypothetical protein
MPPDMPDSSDRLAILFSGENLPHNGRAQRGTGAALWNARNKRQIWVGLSSFGPSGVGERQKPVAGQGLTVAFLRVTS